jgi:hypothetical protein
MSYLSDKKPCSDCGQLYDLDMLNWQNVCRDCVQDDEMLRDLKIEQAIGCDWCGFYKCQCSGLEP